MAKHIFKVGDRVRDSRNHSREGEVVDTDIVDFDDGETAWTDDGYYKGWDDWPYRIQWDDRPAPQWIDSEYAEPIEDAPAKTKVYLAGPMRGIAEFNFPLFLQVGSDLVKDWGYEVFNPAQHDIDRGFDFSGYDGTEDLSDTGFDLRQSLGDDLEFVAREADLVVVLDGWTRSKGARAEVATALALGIPVVSWWALTYYDDLKFTPQITEIPPLRAEGGWLPASNHVARNPAIDFPSFVLPPNAFAQVGVANPEEMDRSVLRAFQQFGADSTALRAAEAEVRSAEAEVRSVSSTGAEKGTKIERFDLLPTQALAKIARHYGVGAAKYAPNNWRKGYEWSKSYAALQRHLNAFWGGEDYDEETGSPHLAAAGFHVLTLLTYMDEQPGFDDRWKGNDD